MNTPRKTLAPPSSQTKKKKTNRETTNRNQRYFLDKWNVLDVITVGFVLVAFAFRMVELATGEGGHLFVAQFFLASTAPLLSSRVLFLSQIGRALGPMTQVGGTGPARGAGGGKKR